MPLNETPFEMAMRYRKGGMSKQTVNATAADRWGMSRKEIRKMNKKIMTRLAMEATSIDVLGELMLVFHQQQQLVDAMTREHKRDDLPASFFNTQRLLLNDCRTTVTVLHEVRKETGRDLSKPPEKKAEREAEYARRAKNEFESLEMGREQGYYYNAKYGLSQAGDELLSYQAAVRDIIRMRMLPKSPYEDYILAEMLGALTEEEMKLDPNKLSKMEVETDLHSWYPQSHAAPGRTQYIEFGEMAKVIFLKRIQEYNEIWSKAEAHVDGLLEARGLKPGMHFPYIGVPPVIRKAAEGDPDAIAEIKETIKPKVDQEELDWGKKCSIVVALLIAFTCAWTCLSLIAGPSVTAMVMEMPGEANDILIEQSDEVNQESEARDRGHDVLIVPPARQQQPTMTAARFAGGNGVPLTPATRYDTIHQSCLPAAFFSLFSSVPASSG